MKREIQELKIDHLLYALRQLVKQFGETSMVDHEVRHLQQGLIASKFPRGIGLQLSARLHDSNLASAPYASHASTTVGDFASASYS